MKKTLVLLILVLALAGTGFADIVRLAPEFSWQGIGNKRYTLRSLRGQPVVLIVAKSAREGEFRKQTKRLKEIYQEFAGRNVIFVAAFVEQGGPIPTDVPFVVADNGPKIAADYGVSGPFGVIVIGTDGNVDMQTAKVVPATRIRDVIINSFPVQSQERNKKKL